MSNSFEIKKLADRASPKVKKYIEQVASHYIKDPALYSHTTDSDLVGEALVIDRGYWADVLSNIAMGIIPPGISTKRLLELEMAGSQSQSSKPIWGNRGILHEMAIDSPPPPGETLPWGFSAEVECYVRACIQFLAANNWAGVRRMLESLLVVVTLARSRTVYTI